MIAICSDCGKQFEIQAKDIRTFECVMEPFLTLYVQVYGCPRCSTLLLAQLDTDETYKQLDVAKEFANRMSGARDRRERREMQKWSKAGLFANKKLDGMQKKLLEKYKGTTVILDGNEFTIDSVCNCVVEEEGGVSYENGAIQH